MTTKLCVMLSRSFLVCRRCSQESREEKHPSKLAINVSSISYELSVFLSFFFIFSCFWIGGSVLPCLLWPVICRAIFISLIVGWNKTRKKKDSSKMADSNDQFFTHSWKNSMGVFFNIMLNLKGDLLLLLCWIHFFRWYLWRRFFKIHLFQSKNWITFIAYFL